jgi:negative regulator of sigma E activity
MYHPDPERTRQVMDFRPEWYERAMAQEPYDAPDTMQDGVDDLGKLTVVAVVVLAALLAVVLLISRGLT